MNGIYIELFYWSAINSTTRIHLCGGKQIVSAQQWQSFSVTKVMHMNLAWREPPPPHFAWARGSNQFFCAFTVFKSKHLWGEKKILVSDNRYTSEWILTLMKQKETNAQNPQKNILDSAWWVRRKLMTAVYFESFTFKSKVVWLPSLISCFVKQQSSCHI